MRTRRWWRTLLGSALPALDPAELAIWREIILEFQRDSRTPEDLMAISIKNDRAEKLAREVAAETGESLTDAVIHSLEERLERLKGRLSAPELAETLMAISRRCSALPDLDTRDADEILGYDEKGAFR
jgi:antitoxin VapB